jgi:hypothetical protein
VSAPEPFPRSDRPEPPRIFTLEIDGRPTLVFEATGLAEAREICVDPDFRSDLGALTSEGVAIYARGATLTPRPAGQAEIAAFQRALGLAPASDEPTMAFLIKVDGVVVIDVDPR